MKKLFSLFALLFALVFAFNGVAFGWGSASGDGSDYRQIQETAVFFNNSGSTLSEGQAVVLDTEQTGVSTGTTLGSYVRLTAVAFADLADNIRVVGIVKATSANQTPVIVVTKGPALGTIDDSSDAVTNRAAVGTSGSTAGRIGGGTDLGIALEPGDGTNGDQIIIWVNPTGAN